MLDTNTKKNQWPIFAGGEKVFNNIKIYNFFCFLFTLFLFIYIFMRSYLFFYTDDEAWSVIDLRYMNFGYFFGSMLNTHLLNSFFIYIETKTIGYYEFGLRIHSVLSFILFALAVYRMSLYIYKIYKRYLFLILMMLHPFMIDYFSLSRGYAMSVAFMMQSIYFIYIYFIADKYASKKSLYLAFFFGGLSVVSCYNMLIYFVSILMLFFLKLILEGNEKIIIKNIVLRFWKERLFFCFNLIFLIFIMSIVLQLKPDSYLDEWPYTSFWGDTVYSILHMFSNKENFITIFIYNLIFSFLIISLIMSMVDFFTTKKMGGHSLFTLLFVIIYILYAVQYYVFNIPYVAYRGAIFLYPLIMLVIFYSFSQSNAFGRLSEKMTFLLYPLAGLLIINFYTVFSLNRGVVIVPNDIGKAIVYINELRVKNENVRLGVSKPYIATMNYYKIRKELSWIKDIGMGYSADKKGILFYGKEPMNSGTYDYFIIDESDITEVSGFQKIEILKKYPESQFVIAKSMSQNEMIK